MPPDVEATVDAIVGHHRERMASMKLRMQVDNGLLGLLRTGLGYRNDLLDGERKAISSTARGIVRAVEKGADLAPEHERFRELVAATIGARLPFEKYEAKAERAARKLARSLPVWEAWAKQVVGFSEGGLAVIVGEAGNLSNYGTHSKLWKRMGVAVMGAGDGLDDHRQGAPGSGATAADWITEGYSKRRRSMLWAYIGNPMIQQMDGPYRAVYDARKIYEVARAQELGLEVAPSAKIPAKRKHEFRSDGHIHLRSHRYMEKRLLRDLWQAWRAAGHTSRADEANGQLPALADNHEPLTAIQPVPMAIDRVPDAARETIAAL
jgi:hypothetical protein